MKILLKDIKDAEEALSKILLTPMDFKLSYNIERVLNKVVSAVKVIEEFRLTLVTKYGAKDEKRDGRMAVLPDKHDAFNDEFIKYLDKESDLEVRLIPFELLEKSNIKLSPADMMALKKFISEPLPTVTKIQKV